MPDHSERATRGSAACAFGDPTCPCQDGDVCHYVDDPLSETMAMTPPTTAAPDYELLAALEQGALCAHRHEANGVEVALFILDAVEKAGYKVVRHAD